MDMQVAAIRPLMHCMQSSYIIIPHCHVGYGLFLPVPATSDHFLAYCFVHAFAVLMNSFLFSLYSLAIPPSTASSG